MMGNLSLYGLPHFYALRSDVLAFPSWTYLYDTKPLLRTLVSHVNFAALNASETAFVITAVDVETGVLKRFSNQKLRKAEYTTIEPQHVLASGSLPPQFPWTEIKDGKDLRCYWDESVKRVLVVMNLFPTTARLPRSFFEVSERVNQLRFRQSHALGHQDGRADQHPNRYDRPAYKLVPGKLPDELANAVDAARALKQVKTIELTLEPGTEPGGSQGFRDFSREGIENRRATGRARALAKLRRELEDQIAPE